MTWQQRINAAILFIENNLASTINLQDVASAAYCSKYHFHRVFYGHFNITPAEYIKRRKLTIAAATLLNTTKNILDIANEFGYDSPNAFTRAFRAVHGVNPSLARRNRLTLKSYQRISFADKPQIGENMNYKIVTIPDFKIIGRSRSFEFDRFVKEGPKFWKEYVNSDEYIKLTKINNSVPRPITNAPMLSAYFPTENGSRDEFTDVLGVEAVNSEELQGFEIHSVANATYAEFECTYNTSMKTNRQIYGEWFASTGFERDGNKPDIVSYFPIPFKPMGAMRVRWWIPIVQNKKG